MRLFVSVDLPEELADPVRVVQEKMADASGLSFTDPEQAHVTLKFLGDVDPDQLDDLEVALTKAVAEADVDPFEATIRGLGAFPSKDYIRVVWVGFGTGGTGLTQLHEAVESSLVERGFEPEEHEFTPHVTIARMEHASGKELVQRVIRESDTAVGTMQVEEVRLTKSELGPDGPRYTTVARFPL